MRTQETDVEVFGGEVESLTTAGIEGVGVRVIVDHRQGYASAGSLDPDVDRRDAARSARQRRRSVSPTSGTRSRRPPTSTASHRADLDLWRDDAAQPADRREGADRARARSRRPRRATRACAASKPRATATRSAESAIVNSLGVEATTRRTTCSAYVGRARRRRLRHADRLRLRGRAVRSPTSTSSRSRVDAVDRAVRLLGAKPIAGRRIPVDPRPARDPVGARRAVERVQRRVGAEGPLAVRGPRRREDRRADRRARRRPDRSRARSARRTHDSEGVPTRRNELIVDGVLRGFLHNVYTGRRSGLRSTGQRGARRLRARRPASACARCALRAGHASRPRRSWRRCRKRSTCSR